MNIEMYVKEEAETRKGIDWSLSRRSEDDR